MAVVKAAAAQMSPAFSGQRTVEFAVGNKPVAIDDVGAASGSRDVYRERGLLEGSIRRRTEMISPHRSLVIAARPAHRHAVQRRVAA